jgi:ribose-phosphate pyrophosphokinase
MVNNVKIASCSSLKYLFNKITDPELSSYKVDLETVVFSDGEIAVQYKESIRGRDLFLFADTAHNLTELLLAIDGAKRSSCKSITVILPYYGYSRQDKKDGHRGSLGASVMAHAIQAFGVNRVVSIDLHADQIQGMFNIPLEHIKGHSIFIPYIKDNIDLTNLVLCSPDAGGVHRVQKYSDKLNIPMVNINKRRDKPNSIGSMELIGYVEGKDVLLLDDIADTAGSLCKATNLLKEKGAISVKCLITHPVLSGDAFKNLVVSKIDQLIISDTIYVQDTENSLRMAKISQTYKKECLLFNIEINDNLVITEVSCVPILEKVIKNLIYDESISELNKI